MTSSTVASVGEWDSVHLHYACLVTGAVQTSLCSASYVSCQRDTARSYSAGPFVISLFLFVKIDLATDSGSEYDRDKKKIGFHFFLHV